MNLKEHYQSALDLFKAGDLQKSKSMAESIVKVQPAFIEAYQLLGMIAKQGNVLPEAIKWYRTALKINPTHPLLLMQLGNLLVQAQQPEDAIKSFDRGLNADPRNSQLMLAKGKALRIMGRYNEAVALFKTIHEREPNHLSAWNQLAACYQALKNFGEAELAFQQALAIDATKAEIWFNYGNLRMECGDIPSAVKAYEKALGLNPGFVNPLMALSKLAHMEGNVDAAKAYLAKALKINPTHFEATFALAALYRSIGSLEESILYFKRAIQVNPRHAMSHNNLGMIYFSIGYQEEAEKAFSAAISADSACAEALFGMAKVKEFHKDHDSALAYITQALSLKPSFAHQLFFDAVQLKLRVADWEEYDSFLSEGIQRLEEYVSNPTYQYQVPPLTLKYLPLEPMLIKAVCDKIGHNHQKEMAAEKANLNFQIIKTPKNKLRIGYISADFRLHAVGMLLHKLFAQHDRDQCEVYAYSIVNTPDHYNANVRAGVDVFREITKQSYRDSALQIHQDKIDVLVDLGGYTTYTRSQILALHPAAIQAHFMGYPGSLGAKLADYILADEMLIPEEHQQQYTEKVQYLHHAFFSSPFQVSEKKWTRKELGLPEDAFVYCCFNSYFKISPRQFKAWLNLLKQNPKAVLWLSKENPQGMANLKQVAKAAGISEDRLIFAERLPMEDYLSALASADLFLDTFNYSAGSTAVCALWAGVPVLTYAGTSNAARMGASIVNATGLTDFITNSEADYFNKALSLSQENSIIQNAKRKLINKNALPLFDLKAAAQDLETAYWQMYKSL
jgi:protein O-GlcNAc transferase